MKKEITASVDMGGISFIIKNKPSPQIFPGKKQAPFLKISPEYNLFIEFHKAHPLYINSHGKEFEDMTAGMKQIHSGNGGRVPCDPSLLGRLEACLTHRNDCVVEIRPHFFTIIDFFMNRADFFYDDVQIRKRRNNVVSHPLLAPFLISFHAFIFHSSAVDLAGRTAMLLAPDGGGKTTIALTAPGSRIIGDDRILVRLQNGAYMAHATPWGRYGCDPMSAPLAGIFFLEKSETFRLEPISLKTAVSFIWEDHCNPLYILPKHRKVMNLDFLIELCRRIPCYRLYTNASGPDWKAVESLLN